MFEYCYCGRGTLLFCPTKDESSVVVFHCQLRSFLGLVSAAVGLFRWIDNPISSVYINFLCCFGSSDVMRLKKMGDRTDHVEFLFFIPSAMTAKIIQLIMLFNSLWIFWLGTAFKNFTFVCRWELARCFNSLGNVLDVCVSHSAVL